jgi:DNA (cytosine-5)-methyltransferase 1
MDARSCAPPLFCLSISIGSTIMSGRKSVKTLQAVPETSAAQSWRFIDLFAGVGGFHQAMTELGGECVFASEIDRDARAVYRANYGMEPEGDIRPLTEGPKVLVPEHDVLCAGFPCQPFSKSGFQRGMEETRGTLFFNILKIIEARRPRFVILENVRNLAGPRQKATWDTIILNLRKLGYRVPDKPTVFSPHFLDKAHDGRPQIRERVFILAEYVADLDLAWMDVEPLVERGPVDGWNPRTWDITDWLQDDSEIEHPSRYALRPNELKWIEAWDDFVKRLAAKEPLPGHPIWAAEFRTQARTFAWTPAWKANFLEKNAALYRRNRWIDAWKQEHGVDVFPDSRQKFEWQAGKVAEPDLWKTVMHLRPSGLRVKSPTYLPALVAINQTSIIGSRRRRITPREAARLQGLPDGFLLHEKDAVTYKQMGNAVNVGVVKHVARALFDASDIGWPAVQLPGLASLTAS